jgi:hypothetical protein
MTSSTPAVLNQVASSKKLGFFSLSRDRSHLFKVAALVAVIALALVFTGALIAPIGAPVALVIGTAFVLAGLAGFGFFGIRLTIAVESCLRHKPLNSTKPPEVESLPQATPVADLIKELNDTEVPKEFIDPIVAFCLSWQEIRREKSFTDGQKIKLINAGEATFEDFGCKTIEEAFEIIKKAGIKTERFKIPKGVEIQEGHFKQIKEACPSLKSLDLRNCLYSSFTNASFTHLKDLPLEHLNLSGCHQLTNAALAPLKDLPLQHLDLRGCSNITYAGLTHLKDLPLKRLDLAGCYYVTDAALACLKGLPLQKLNVSGCHQLTNAVLDHLKDFTLLKRLDLIDCPNLTSQDKILLGTILCECQIL